MYRRDDKAGIPWPGLIDLPGGGREGSESPAQCALRELREEFGLAIPEQRIVWARPFPSLHPSGRIGWMLALPLTAAEVAAIVFGDEGRDPQLLEIGAFLAAPDGVAPLQDRVRQLMESSHLHAVLKYHTGKTSLFP